MKFKSDKKTRNEIMEALSLLTQIGITVTVTIVICLLFGGWLDKKFDTSPLFLIIFMIIGMGAAFKGLYTMTKKFGDRK